MSDFREDSFPVFGMNFCIGKFALFERRPTGHDVPLGSFEFALLYIVEAYTVSWQYVHILIIILPVWTMLPQLVTHRMT